MSELTICNRCSLDRMEARARERGVEVIVTVLHPVGDPDQHMAGWISARYSDQEEPSAWFVQLTMKCAC